MSLHLRLLCTIAAAALAAPLAIAAPQDAHDCLKEDRFMNELQRYLA